MSKRKSQPIPVPEPKEDFDLISPEDRRRSAIRRWSLVGAAIALLLIAFIWVVQAPARRGIKHWQSSRLARQAVALTDKQDWENATNKARDAFQLDEGDVEAWRAIAHLLSRTEQNAVALEWWRKVEGAGQLTIADRREYASSALRTGELNIAATQIDRLFVSDQNPSPEDILLRAHLESQRGDGPSALEDTARVLGDAKVNPFQTLSAATLNLALTRPESGRYLAAWKKIEEIGSDPKNVASLEALALLAQQQRPLPATSSGQSGLSLQQTTPATNLTIAELADRLEKHPRAQPYHQLLAMKLRAQTDPARAEALLSEAIGRFRESDDQTLLALNTWLYKEGRYQQMLDGMPLERAVKRRELYLQYLDALAALGRFQEVKELLQSERFRLDPVSQHMYLATASQRLGEENATRNEWARALEAADEVDKCMILGAFAERAGEPGVAESAYAQAIAFAPSTRAPYEARLRVARALGETARAKSVASELVRLWPDDEHARNDEAYLGLLLGADGGEAEKAIRESEVLAVREPMNWQARATVALANLKLGRPAAALEAFHGIQAVEGVPVGPLAVRAVALDANGWKDGARGDAHTLSTASLLPEERALLAPLLRD